MIGDIGSMAASPDGKYLAFTYGKPGESNIYSIRFK
jgi:Tol biopolymer transport system component